jgi:hypothetical protein
MAHPYQHALASVQRWGGTVECYLRIHAWLDSSKAFLPDFRHRALRHHAEGIFWAEEVFGVAITNSVGRVVPVRWIAELHVKQDLGWIPTLQDWFKHLRVQPWMAKVGDRKLARGEMRRGAFSTAPVECPSEETGPVAEEAPAGRVTTTSTNLYRVLVLGREPSAHHAELARARSHTEAAEVVRDHRQKAYAEVWADGQELSVLMLREPEDVGTVYEPTGEARLFVIRADQITPVAHVEKLRPVIHF